MRALLAALLVTLAIPTLAAADKVRVDVTTSRLAALKTAARCDDKASPWRPWCVAADFETGTAAELPKGKVLVGMTVELEEGKDAAAALSGKVSLTALAIDADGKVKVTMVKPENKQEEQAVAEAVFNTASVFKGKAATAKLPKELADYFKTLKGAYAATKSGSQWTWTGASAGKLRKVGSFWVAIEVPKANNGIFATILTDAWQ
jgi:hypothetical protein